MANQAVVASGIGCSDRLHQGEDSDRLVGKVGAEPDSIFAVDLRF